MSVDFTGRRVLLVAPVFFGFDKTIAEGLRRRGATVALYDDRPSTSTFTKAAIRIHPRLMAARTARYVQRIIDSHAGERFDDVLVIKGQGLTRSLLKRLLDAFPGARKRYYLYDSFRNDPGARGKMTLFDRVLTFDQGDARGTPGLQFRPMFYPEEFRRMSPRAARHDEPVRLVFIGTVHSDRYRVLGRLRRALPKMAVISTYLYFPSRMLYAARRLLDPSFWAAPHSEFKFVPLDRAAYAALFEGADVVVEMERPVQAGLTMRSLEAVAAGRKLITTNPEIAQYDFYRPANIAIVDRAQPVISVQFLRGAYEPVPGEIVDRYSLDRWLDDVFGG
ncbi:MAG TPA: hypothetical protein VFB36_10325 [Nevskiaceae bacterium]|nr:hypothetical protein [Nevskiaceae bacterium]